LQDMVERGEVKLDATVASLLPPDTGLPSGGGEQIALLDLATHYSGLPRVPDDLSVLNDANPYANYDATRMYGFLARSALALPPGQRYEYSSLGFALLGDVLARRAGGDYARLVLDRVATPLDMRDSWFSVPEAERARMAQGQNADGEARTPWDLAAFTPAGGIRSSARDMAHLLSAALAQPDAPGVGVLSATMTAQREIPGGQIGLAWHIMTDGLIWHNGETGACHSFAAIDRGQRVGVLLLAASAGVIVDRLGMALLDLMRGTPPEPLEVPATMDVDPSALDEYAGRYPLADDLALELWRDGEVLRGQATDQPAFRLWPLLTDLFYLRVVEAQIDFQRDADGKVVSLILHQGGATQRAFREPLTR
jgi:D-alanyl-D-alanine-carboxypeptidase/D-alanyl-D-alanine-endopeptidase